MSRLSNLEYLDPDVLRHLGHIISWHHVHALEDYRLRDGSRSRWDGDLRTDHLSVSCESCGSCGCVPLSARSFERMRPVSPQDLLEFVLMELPSFHVSCEDVRKLRLIAEVMEI